MQNLWVRKCYDFPIDQDDGGQTISLWRSLTSDSYLLRGGAILKLSCNEATLLADLQAEGFLPDNASCVGMEIIPDSASLLLAISTGLLLQVSTEGFGEVEEVGCVEAGFLALALSPDLELVSLVTGDLKLITMTRDFLPVREEPLLGSEFGSGLPVSVGWGKKETQFHGSEGKAARSKVVEQSGLVDSDDGRVRISWRGDGAMLAVSLVVPGGDRSNRVVKVVSREGQLYSTSEVLPGLEQSLAWRPSGNIGVVQTKPDKHVVAFLEKNGLQHGEMVLRGDVMVRELAWSCDGSVLMIWTESPTDGSSLQLWTTSNYHWFLKQTLREETGEIVAPQWSAEDPLSLQYLLRSPYKKEKLRSLSLAWRNDCGGVLATAAVVDGQTVQLTPFREVVVPPPSSALELQLGSQVKQVVWPKPGEGEGVLGQASSNTDSLLVILSNRFAVFETGTPKSVAEEGGAVKVTGAGGNGFAVKCSMWHLSAMLACPELPNLTNIVWVGGKLVAACMSSQHIVVLQENDGILQEVERLECEAPIWLIAAKKCGAVIQLEGGLLLELDLQKDTTSLLPCKESFPCSCDPMLVTEEQDILGLSSRHRLMLGSKELASNVTSVALHSHFLLATTMDHRLLTRPLASLDSGTWETAGSRRVERGSRLVVAVPSHSRTILQMPRGNLEVVQPRALAILMLADLLDQTKYAEAFLLARRQRMNLNLLVDHNLQAFSTNLPTFVEQMMDKPDQLNLLIAELVEEDVTTTMYAAHYPAISLKTLPMVGGKVSRVCKQVREELEKQDKSELKMVSLLPILGTLVREGGNGMEEALARIRDIRDAGLKSKTDEALKFLLYMVDVNVLYDVALGTYDFDLVMMVAEKSQKDPKEYLPFLNSLKAMEVTYGRFSIDKHLKRWSKALVHIASLPDKLEECLQVVEEHRLYQQALPLFAPGCEGYKRVCRSYAVYLSSKRYSEEASYMYERSGDHSLAAEAAEEALAWGRAGFLAKKAGWSQEKVTEMGKGLASKLESGNRGCEAATIFREWLDDREEAVAVLARTYQWQEALRSSRVDGRDDLVETHIQPAMVERQKVLEGSIQSQMRDLQAMVERLGVVRKSRTAALEGDVEEDERNLEDADIFSDTSSVGGAATTVRTRSTLQTRATNKTSKSSKTRRKADRKLYSTKEGSAHEDLGIIVAVHEQVSKLPAMRDEVGKLLRGLAEIGQERAALSLQNALQDLLDQAVKVLLEVWPEEDKEGEQFGPEATVEEIVRGAKKGGGGYVSPLHLLPSHLRVPPYIKQDASWRLQIIG